MNSFGYDYYSYNDTSYFDEVDYTEQYKSLDKIENFNNNLDTFLNNDNDDDNDNENSTNILQTLCDQKDKYCKILKHKYENCAKIIQNKNIELSNYSAQTFLLYILLIFAIIFIFYQRLNINNLNQLVYILRWNLHSMPSEKKL